MWCSGRGAWGVVVCELLWVGVKLCNGCGTVYACGAADVMLQMCCCGVWYCGVRYCGVRYCGVWYCGVRYCGVWYCGVRYCGVRYGGVRYSGVWYCGVWYCGVRYGGVHVILRMCCCDSVHLVSSHKLFAVPVLLYVPGGSMELPPLQPLWCPMSLQVHYKITLGEVVRSKVFHDKGDRPTFRRLWGCRQTVVLIVLYVLQP